MQIPEPHDLGIAHDVYKQKVAPVTLAIVHSSCGSVVHGGLPVTSTKTGTKRVPSSIVTSLVSAGPHPVNRREKTQRLRFIQEGTPERNGFYPAG